MLVCGLGIGLIVAGIVALATGKFKVTASREVRGVPARLLGAALLTPLPVSFVVVLIYTITQVDANNQAQVNAWAQQHDLKLSLIMAGIMIFMAVVIVGIAAAMAKPIKAKRRKRRPVRDYDDEDDDRPHRRRRDEIEDEDHDRPRRRKRDDLDDRAR